MNKKADILFEVSWEVCNKVGGIYTVVKSKAARMADAYGSSCFPIGPYFASKALGEFQEEVPNEICKLPFEELKKEGIICHFGKKASDAMIKMDDVTTARVVAAPTPSAPPSTRIPSKQEIVHMIEAKTSVLKR